MTYTECQDQYYSKMKVYRQYNVLHTYLDFSSLLLFLSTPAWFLQTCNWIMMPFLRMQFPAFKRRCLFSVRELPILADLAILVILKKEISKKMKNWPKTIILPSKVVVGVKTNPRELKRRRHRSVTEVTLLPLGRSSSSSTFFWKSCLHNFSH